MQDMDFSKVTEFSNRGLPNGCAKLKKKSSSSLENGGCVHAYTYCLCNACDEL